MVPLKKAVPEELYVDCSYGIRLMYAFSAYFHPVVDFPIIAHRAVMLQQWLSA